MEKLTLEELYSLYNFLLEKGLDKRLEKVSRLITEKENCIFENTSATGGPSGSLGSSSVGYGGNGVSMSNATTAGMGGVVSPQASAFPGALNGVDWINGGGKSGSGDTSVPFNPSGKNRIFQKIPVMSKSHGARTGKKSRIKGIDLMSMKSLLNKNKNKETDMKPRTSKVMSFDNFQKDEISKVTKIKEGKTDKSSKLDKKGPDKFVDKKDNFRTEVKNLVKSHKDFSIEKVGNDLSISKGKTHIAQIMFRDNYVGVKKSDAKFADEFKYNELGKLKSKINEILK